MASPSTSSTLERMASHRSVREYRDGELDDAAVRAAVAAAQQAATSANVQAYCLLRITDPDERQRLAELAGGQAQVARSGAFFVVCGDLRRHRLVAQDAGAPSVRNLEVFLLAAIDASLFAQNLVLAFESRDLGTCYIGGLRNRLPEVDALLELPDGVLPFFGLCVGEPAGDPGLRPRLPLDAVYFHDRYPSDERMRELVAEYDATMGEYYERRGKPGHDWSGALWRMFREARRTDLAAYYRSKGAGLE